MCLASLLQPKRTRFWLPSVPYRFPRILTYHLLAEPRRDRPFRGLKVRPATFARQVAELAGAGWSFFTLAELAAGWRAGTLPEKAVALTFDDGYRDNLEMLPVLEKHGAKATVFVVIERENNDWVARRGVKKGQADIGQELVRQPKLSDADLCAMLATGRVEIGSHTIRHEDLTRCDEAGKQSEIVASKAKLEAQFGVEVKTFCYPFGAHDDRDAALAKAAGYAAAVTTVGGICAAAQPDFWRLPRIEVGEATVGAVLHHRLRHGK